MIAQQSDIMSSNNIKGKYYVSLEMNCEMMLLAIICLISFDNWHVSICEGIPYAYPYLKDQKA